jgi:DNA-binding transcriptional regulator YiaG
MKRTAPDSLDFREWRDRLGLTQDEAAAALGRTKRMIRNYEVGDLPVPRVVTLAMLALEDHPELCRPAEAAE